MSPRVRWYVYVLYSVSTGRLFVGLSTAPSARLEKHNLGTGAKATKHGRPWRLVYVSQDFPTRTDAVRREYEIKQLKRAQKLIFVGLAA